MVLAQLVKIIFVLAFYAKFWALLFLVPVLKLTLLNRYFAICNQD